MKANKNVVATHERFLHFDIKFLSLIFERSRDQNLIIKEWDFDEQATMLKEEEQESVVTRIVLSLKMRLDVERDLIEWD